MSTYAVVRLPDDDEDIMVPADDFEVSESGELLIFRLRPTGNGEMALRLWAQFSSYVGCYMVDDLDASGAGAGSDDGDEDEGQAATAVTVPVTASETPALVGTNHGPQLEASEPEAN